MQWLYDNHETPFSLVVFSSSYFASPFQGHEVFLLLLPAFDRPWGPQVVFSLSLALISGAALSVLLPYTIKALGMPIARATFQEFQV